MMLCFVSAVVEAARSAHAGVAVVFDMVFGRLVRMTAGDLCMAVCDERLMRGVCVVAFLIVLGRIAVMPRSRFMMIGRCEMMFLAREYFRHGFSNAVM